jgi:hypothetical protein
LQRESSKHLFFFVIWIKVQNLLDPELPFAKFPAAFVSAAKALHPTMNKGWFAIEAYPSNDYVLLI